MDVRVVHRLLERNDQAAAQNRARFAQAGVTCLNVLGGAGCGKTTLLEGVIPRLGGLRVAVLEGDLNTTDDAERIAALGRPAVQLLTDGSCHLTASLVQRGLDELGPLAIDLLIVENVGNPVCPANFDLGEHIRLSVLSVAEGDDKVRKYPKLFRDAHAVAITKCDLLGLGRFRIDRVEVDLARVCPDAALFRTDAGASRGFDELARWLGERVAARRAADG